MCKFTIILAEAVKLCLVNINRKFFHLFKQCKFDKLDSQQRAQDLTVFDRHVTCHDMSCLYIVTSGFFLQNKFGKICLIFEAFLIKQLFHSRLLDMR